MTCVATITNVVTSSEAVTIALTSSIVTQRPGASSCLLFSTKTALQNIVPTPASITRTGSDNSGFGGGEFWTNFDNGDERGAGGWGGRFERARSTSFVPIMKRQTDVSCLSWVAVATPVTEPVTAYITSWATATSTNYDTRIIACEDVDQSPTETIGSRPTSSSDTGLSFTQVIPSVPSNEKAINSDLTMGSDSSTLSLTGSLTSDSDASMTSSTLTTIVASVATADASSFSQLHLQGSSVSTATQGSADQTASGENVLQSSMTGTVYPRTSLRASQSRSAPIDVPSTAAALPNGDLLERSHAGKIAGIIIGVLIASAVVGLLFWAWLWKKKRAAKRDSRQPLTLRPSSPTGSEKSQYPESVRSYTERPLLASRFSNSSSYHSRRQSLSLFARRWTGAWFRPMSGFGTPPPVPPIPPIPPLPHASRGMYERPEFPIDICNSEQAEADQSTGATDNPFGRIHPDFPENWAPPGLTRPAGTRVTLTPAAGSDADMESTRTLSLSGLSATSRPHTPSSRASWQQTPLWREILRDNSPRASRTAF